MSRQRQWSVTDTCSDYRMTVLRRGDGKPDIDIGDEDDARLTSAAPELLEALQAAIDCGMVPISSAKEGGASTHSRQVHVADQIRAAIAKATG